jgi:hypothetical protein
VDALELPYVDEPTIAVAAPPQATWAALLAVVERAFGSPGATQLARLLGCTPSQAAGPRPLDVGSTLPGFEVTLAEPLARLTLAGRHRFSRYALSFRLHPHSGGATLLRAETRAAFPGLHGGIYRELVIGSRAHALLTRRILVAVARRAGDAGRAG